MAITSITIENFKCIGDAVTIPIRPITLLFGKNSSGKSTVLQALHYMREVCEHADADPDRTLMGGDHIDLGDFRSKVHRHELDRKIRIRIEFGLTPKDSDSLKQGLDHVTNPHSNKIEVITGWIELVIGWDAENHVAYIESDGYGLNGTEWICHLVERPEVIPSDIFGSNSAKWNLLDKLDKHRLYLNFKHPFIQAMEMDDLNNFPTKLWSKIPRMLMRIAVIELRDIRYLGPLRNIPSRDYHAQKSDESLWAEGLEAWNALARDPQLLKKTNFYMRDVLKLGYSIQISRQTGIIKLHNEENNIDLDLLDVGLGISQVIPVLVGALHYGSPPSGKFFIVEQPELHLHPAVQVVLGDVFIDCINTFVREFSELKETFESTEEKGYQDVKNINKYATIWMNFMKENIDHPYLEELIKNTGENSLSKVAASILRMFASNEAEYKKFMNKLRLNRRVLLIETHSEHLLLRIMRRMRETSEDRIEEGRFPVTPDDVAVLFVESHNSRTIIREMPVNKRGELVKAWPGGFFEEDIEEVLA